MTVERWRKVVERIATDLTDEWRDAFLRVPRQGFIPDQIWRADSRPFVTLHRGDDPDGWLDLVYRDDLVITQVDDGTPTGPGGAGHRITSSSSMPTVMAVMLNALDVRDGDRVLEIGTGTGYNAALLAARLGDELVTTVEIHPEVTENARAALDAAGYRPRVVTGDGVKGYPPDAPYDRVLATASVLVEVPYAWVEQTRPGGLIVTPWGTSYLSSSLLRLTVAEDGSASGRFVDHAAFMSLRDHRVPGDIPDYEHEESDESTTSLHPYEPVGNYGGGAFAVSVLVPDCDKSIAYEDDEHTRYEVLLWDTANTSWATVEVTPDSDRYPVRQHGPRRLWDEVEQAHDWWEAQGTPAYTRFGLSVTPERQWVWLDHPSKRLPEAMTT